MRLPTLAMSSYFASALPLHLAADDEDFGLEQVHHDDHLRAIDPASARTSDVELVEPTPYQ